MNQWIVSSLDLVDKLLHSDGRELRRSLFSLKQIFQDDKDLVHEFVNNQGLQCLIKIGGAADQNYQNYILRGLFFIQSKDEISSFRLRSF